MNYLKSDYHIMNNFIDLNMVWVGLLSLTLAAYGGQSRHLLGWRNEMCACHLVFIYYRPWNSYCRVDISVGKYLTSVLKIYEKERRPWLYGK